MVRLGPTREDTPVNETSQIERRITRVIVYIYDNLAGDLSLDTLADVAAMSRFHWHRTYRAVTGETAVQTVRRLRMYRASYLLANSEAAIAEVGAQVGYPNPDSFARTFAESHGVSPSAFRTARRISTDGPDLSFEKRSYETMLTSKHIREDPPRRLAGLAHSGAYHQIGGTFEKLAGIAGARGLFGTAGPMVGIYLDDPSVTEEAKLRSFAGMVVPDETAIEAPLTEHQLPASRLAVGTYVGPYANLQEAWSAMYADYLAELGETVADRPCFEIYLNSPANTAPDELITELCVPLA